ncbi:MAG: hypothetical protein ACJ71Q_10395 [Terriglobales bacterium]
MSNHFHKVKSFAAETHVAVFTYRNDATTNAALGRERALVRLARLTGMLIEWFVTQPLRWPAASIVERSDPSQLTKTPVVPPQRLMRLRCTA